MKPDSPDKPLTMRCSTVFISEGASEIRVFRSIDEIPVRLRARLFDPGRPGGSATIFIANRGGREELARRFKGLPSNLRTRLERGIDRAQAKRTKAASSSGSAAELKRRLPDPPRFAQLAAAQSAPTLRLAMMVAAGGGLLFGLLQLWP
jgi:hypothetical protein